MFTIITDRCYLILAPPIQISQFMCALVQSIISPVVHLFKQVR